MFASAAAPKRAPPEVSPAGLADDPCALARALGGSAATLSQPNSSSSLTSLLVEGLEVRVAPTHPALAAFCFENSEDAETSGEGCDGPLSPCTLSDVSHEDAVEALTHFDAHLCAALARLRPHPPPGFDDGFRVPCHRLEPVYLNLGPDAAGEVKMPGLTVRPTRTWSNTLPPTAAGAHAYNLSALLAEFKLKKSQDKSPAAGAAPPPRSWPAANAGGQKTRPAPRPTTPLAPKDDEPAAIVMIPGMRRKV